MQKNYKHTVSMPSSFRDIDSYFFFNASDTPAMLREDARKWEKEDFLPSLEKMAKRYNEARYNDSISITLCVPLFIRTDYNEDCKAFHSGIIRYYFRAGNTNSSRDFNFPFDAELLEKLRKLEQQSKK